MEISIGQYESLRPKAQVRIDEHKLEFVVPNRIIAWRVKTILTKEPETIKWLKKIQRDDIFFDIGANIGLYSIFAAVCQGADVYGFEPESQNYSIFLKNIVLNNLSSRVTAFGLAISNNIMIDRLFLSEFLWDGGQSCHSFGERVGPNLEERHSKVVQGCVSWTLDDLIDKKYVPIPRFIKIDVDGFEHRVIDGAKKTLENKKVESICIEINPKIKEHAEIVPLMRDLGFEYDRQQVSKSERITGPFVGCAEYIFYRPEIKRVFVRLPFDGGVLAGDNINKEGKIEYIRKKIETCELNSDPFPYMVVDDIFPGDFYERIIKQFPKKSSLVPLSETGRTIGYKERNVLILKDESISSLKGDQLDLWKEFLSLVSDEKILLSAIRKFYPWCASRVYDATNNEGVLEIKFDGLAVIDEKNYSIGPHTDAPHRLLSFLFYLPSDSNQKHFGTSFYRHHDKDFACSGGPHYALEEFEKYKTIEFLPNRLVCFVRTDKSFHGVEKIDDDVERRLVIVNIRDR